MKHLELENINVSYGDKRAVKSLNITLNEGDILGFIGVNGSGKSSTIKAIMGLVNFEGTIRVLDRNIKNDYIYKKNIGYIPENVQMFEGFRGKEYLIYIGGLQGISEHDTIDRCSVLINKFGLDNLINKKIASYSKGNKQKLAIIASLIHRPKILLLDEPLDGLDPHSIEIYILLLKIHVENGGSVLYSSHILEVVAKLSNRIAIISKGVVIKDSNLLTMQSELKSDYTLNQIFDSLTNKTDYSDLKNALRGVFSE